MPYDVFLSHASADKSLYVENLEKELSLLGIKTFYDDHSILWGEKIKDKIDNALSTCKFAIIVISKNYFGREWTEYEIGKLLLRQQQSIKPFIFPILLDISKKELVEHYPELGTVKFKYAKAQSNKDLALDFKKIIDRIK